MRQWTRKVPQRCVELLMSDYNKQLFLNNEPPHVEFRIKSQGDHKLSCN